MKVALLASALLASAAGAQTAWQGEFLLPPADPAFVLAWVAPPAAPAPMREWLPRGESEEHWTRIVTVLQYPQRPGLTPQAVLERLAASFGPACPAAHATAVTTDTLGGHPSATVRVDCPRNPRTGLPETMWARTVLGDERIGMVQAALRRVPSAADTRWAEGVLAGTTLCGRGPRCDAARDAAPGTGL